MTFKMNPLCRFLLITASTITMTNAAYARENMAPVTGYARAFPVSHAIPFAKIKVLETGTQYETDANGNFGPFDYPVGKPITLVFQKQGYKTVQSATIIMPQEGLTGPQHNITFQVPAIGTYYLLEGIIGAHADPSFCHVTATIADYQKTLNDDRQGAVGATIVLTPYVDVKPFYFDIFESGPFKGKTNPFTRGLTHISADGGVALFNLPVRDEPYTLSAVRDGSVFSEAKFSCTKDAFINISPPHGPTVQNKPE